MIFTEMVCMVLVAEEAVEDLTLLLPILEQGELPVMAAAAAGLDTEVVGLQAAELVDKDLSS
jgi:hypothetical protein